MNTGHYKATVVPKEISPCEKRWKRTLLNKESLHNCGLEETQKCPNCSRFALPSRPNQRPRSAWSSAVQAWRSISNEFSFQSRRASTPLSIKQRWKFQACSGASIPLILKNMFLVPQIKFRMAWSRGREAPRTTKNSACLIYLSKTCSFAEPALRKVRISSIRCFKR